MEQPTLYKKVSLKDINSKPTTTLTADEQSRVNTILSKFFELFTTKHM